MISFAKVILCHLNTENIQFVHTKFNQSKSFSENNNYIVYSSILAIIGTY